RRSGITKRETLQLARDTWETVPADRARLCKQDYSWMANVANMAALAWPEKAKERAIYKMANTAAPQARFPAFFGPGHDWLPDHNWGGSGMTGLQEMLLAPEPGPMGKLNLFPAWPAEWDVDFKLHAPGQTVVEGVLQGGKLVSLKVTPNFRAKDIVNWLGKQPAYQPPPPLPLPLSQGKQVTVSSQFDQPGYEAARACDGDLKTRWASDFAARDGWLAVDLGEEKKIGRVWISEVEWPETREFAIEVKQGDNWKEIARGTTIGADKAIEFTPVRAREIRLHVFKAERPININEFQVFQ
ncbi:MAG: discoidin domain-containing protein, partial [bacterium]